MPTDTHSFAPPLHQVYPTYERALTALTRMTNAGLAHRDIDIVEELPLEPDGMAVLEHESLESAIASGCVVLVVRTHDEEEQALAKSAMDDFFPPSDENTSTVAANL